jgi:hypothetical protein
MTDDKTEAVVGLAASLVLPTLVGVAAGWPVWVIALVVAALLAITAVALRQGRHRRRQAALRAEHLRYETQQSTPPPEPTSEPLSAGRIIAPVTLPTSLPDYRFTFTCTVRWQSHPRGGVHAAPDAVAADAVVQRARRITAGHHPQDDGAVHALAAALGQAESDPGQHVVAWATDVRLEVAPEDRDRLRRVAEVRKQQHVWEQEVAAERAVRTYLGDDVLTSTGSTVVWWLARHTGQVREAVDLIGTLAQLSAAAGDKEVDEVFRHLLPGHAHRPTTSGWSGSGYDETILNSRPLSSATFVVNGNGTATTDTDGPSAATDETVTEEADAPRDDLLPDPEPDEALFGHQLADLLERHDHGERARRARERYGAADWITDDPGPEQSPEDD